MIKVQSSKFKVQSLRRGFTVVELLVVIAIIGFLVSLVLVQMQGARARARDAEREQEIRTIQNALALYVVNASSYPVYSGDLTGADAVSVALRDENAITQIPLDPLNSGNYKYTYESAGGITYTLTYYLETDSISGKSAGVQTASP